MKIQTLLALTLVAALASDAEAQRWNASSSTWRAKVLGPEGRLHDDPQRDFDGTIGPQYVYKNGWWYTADWRWVYFEGRWVDPASVVWRTERTLVIKPAPTPEG